MPKGKPCTICTHERRQEIDAALAAGSTGNVVARDFALSVPSVYRHIRAGHANAPSYVPQIARYEPVASPEPVSAPPVPLASDKEKDAALREAKAVRREAWRHLREARKEGDTKSINGAISAATKAQDHLAQVRGVIRNGNALTVNNLALTQVAIDAHARAADMATGDVLDLAEGEISAQAQAGSAHALAAIRRLARLLDVSQAIDATDVS